MPGELGSDGCSSGKVESQSVLSCSASSSRSHFGFQAHAPPYLSASFSDCPFISCAQITLNLYISGSPYLLTPTQLKSFRHRCLGLRSIIFVQQTAHNSLAARTNRYYKREAKNTKIVGCMQVGSLFLYLIIGGQNDLRSVCCVVGWPMKDGSARQNERSSHHRTSSGVFLGHF